MLVVYYKQANDAGKLFLELVALQIVLFYSIFLKCCFVFLNQYFLNWKLSFDVYLFFLWLKWVLLLLVQASTTEDAEKDSASTVMGIYTNQGDGDGIMMQ